MHSFPLNWLPLGDACLLLYKGNTRILTCLCDPVSDFLSYSHSVSHPSPENEPKLHPHLPKPLPVGPLPPLCYTLLLPWVPAETSPRCSGLPFLPAKIKRAGTHGLGAGRFQPFLEKCLSSVTLLWLFPHSKPWARMLSPLLHLLEEALRECGWL